MKGAYIEEAVYIGDDQLDMLVDIKSKEELIGEIIGLLQSPAKNVVSALQSSGGKLSGIIKTLSRKKRDKLKCVRTYNNYKLLLKHY